MALAAFSRRRLWLAFAVAAVAMLLALGHWGPDAGLRWGVQKALLSLGWSRVSVPYADLSLFNGAIVIKSMEAGDGLGIDGLDIRFRWRPLLSRRLTVESLDLTGVIVQARRTGDRIEINGLPLTGTDSNDAGAWSFDVSSLVLRDSRLDLTDGALTANIAIERFELHDLKSWAPDEPARFRLVGRINGAPVTIDGQATPFAASPAASLSLALERFDLAAIAELARRSQISPPTGRVGAQLTLAADAEGMRLQGQITASALSAALPDGKASAERLHWVGQARLGPDRTIGGTLTAEGIALDHTGRKLGLQRLIWTGDIDFDSEITAKGKAEMDQARLDVDSLQVQFRHARAEGHFAQGHAEGLLPPLATEASLTVDGLTVTEPGIDWLRAERIEATDVHLAAGQPARIARLEGRAIAALSGRGSGEAAFRRRLESRQIGVESIRIDADGRVAIGTLALSGAIVRATRTKSGWQGKPESPDGEDRPQWSLARLSLDGASKLEFEDRTPSERVRIVLDGVDLTVTDLDTFRPNRDSPISLKARIGEGRLTLSGSLRPFAEIPSGTLTGSVRSLELPPLSPYAADTLGVHLHTGQLDGEARVSSTDGKLDGKLDLTLAQLFIAQPDPHARLAKQAEMPVETVLDLLRDSDNRIRLTIPVRGDLGNPDFDVSDAVGQAVGGALKSTVITTFKLAFPVAALIGLVIDEAENPRLSLEPLSFPPGSAALNGAATDRLRAVGELLAKRPGLKLSLCGTAEPDTDWPALLREASLMARLQQLIGRAESAPPDPARLAELAQSRARSAKTYLVEQGGIDPGRLFTCRPQVGGANGVGPGVKLLL